jgi:hypothetical protein
LARAHWSTARCPPSAAHEQVPLSHEQPCARAHWSTSRCPPLAANELVRPIPWAAIHTSAQPDAHPQLHVSTCAHPTGGHALEPTGAHPGAHPQLHMSRCAYPTGSHSRKSPDWSTARCPYPAAHEQVPLSHWQPLARAHWSTARCPTPAAHEHVPLSHGQPFAPTGPQEHTQVPALCSTHACALIPRAVIRSSPLEHRQVPTLRCS